MKETPQSLKVQGQADFLNSIFENANFVRSWIKISVNNYSEENLTDVLKSYNEKLFNVYDSSEWKKTNKYTYILETNDFKEVCDYVLIGLNKELVKLEGFLNTCCDDKNLRNDIKRQKALITRINNKYNILQ